MKVTYNGKEMEREVVCDGVVKAGEAFLVRCNESGVWCYCAKERFDKLVAKFGSQELVGQKHISREGKTKRDAAEGTGNLP